MFYPDWDIPFLLEVTIFYYFHVHSTKKIKKSAKNHTLQLSIIFICILPPPDGVIVGGLGYNYRKAY